MAKETRNRRISLVVTPSLDDGITALAQITGTSVNGLICGILEDVIRKNKPMIQRFLDESRQMQEKYCEQLTLFDVDDDGNVTYNTGGTSDGTDK